MIDLPRPHKPRSSYLDVRAFFEMFLARKIDLWMSPDTLTVFQVLMNFFFSFR